MVSELAGAELALRVARVIGLNAYIGRDGECFISDGRLPDYVFKPHENWVHGGMLIEREKINLMLGDCDGTYWEAHIGGWMSHDFVHGEHRQEGLTPLIAAMRALVASKYGETVPEEPQNAHA